MRLYFVPDFTFIYLMLCCSKLDIDYLYMSYADIMAKVRPLCLIVT